MDNDSKKTYDETLKSVLSDIEHSFGRGSIMVLGDRPKVATDVLSSGSILLDDCLGCGGYPKGRIVEIYGPESSGKTTLALTAIAETQKNGGRCAFIDAEQSIDPTYAKNLGDRKSTRLNSSHQISSYAVFCLKKKKKAIPSRDPCCPASVVPHTARTIPLR